MTSESWKGRHGSKRIVAEFRAVADLVEKGLLPQISNLSMHQDRIDRWRFHASDFDNETIGGRQLNADLAVCKKRYGQGFIRMEAAFPEDYPTHPFFVRVISPRCCFYTGHVTAGGSICIEALVPTGGPGGWQPSFTFESVMTLILTNMVDCEASDVRTVNGPGGKSGPLRIDLDGLWHGQNRVMVEYGESEAKSAYHRMVENHTKLGWPAPPSNPAANLTTAGPSLAGSSANQMKKRRRPTATALTSKDPIASTALTSKDPIASTALTSKDPIASTAGRDQRAVASKKDTTLHASGSSKQPQAPSSPPVVVGSSKIFSVDLVSDEDETEASEKRPRRSTRGGQGASMLGAVTRPRTEPSSALPVVVTIVDSQEEDLVEIVAFKSADEAPSSSAVLLTATRPNESSKAPDAAQVELDRLKRQLARRERKISELEREKQDKDVQIEAAARSATEAAMIAKNLAAQSSAVAEAVASGSGAGPSSSSLLHSVPPPANWQPCQPGKELETVLVCLPWPPGSVNENEDLLMTAEEEVFEERVGELIENGVAEVDARAALTYCLGDYMKASRFVSDTRRKGGAARVVALEKERTLLKSSLGVAAAEAAAKEAAEAKEALRKKTLKQLQDEADMVVQRWENKSGLSGSKIVSIERVQNRVLWSKFSMRKAEVISQAGATKVEDNMMWHGSHRATILKICQEGFDHRVSNLMGALGAGVYFAESAGYSIEYSSRPQIPNAAAQVAYGGMSAHLQAQSAMLSQFGITAGSFSRLLAPLYPPPPPPIALPSVKGKKQKKGAKKTSNPSALDCPGAFSMLLCNVVVGRSAPGNTSLRRPPDGFDSVYGAGAHGTKNYALFDNSQAYPAYLVHFNR